MTWKKKQALIRRETPSLSIPKTVVRVCVCLLLYSIIIPNDVLLLSSSFFSFHGVSTRPIYVATLIALIIWHERRKDINRKTKLKKTNKKQLKNTQKNKQKQTNKTMIVIYIIIYISPGDDAAAPLHHYTTPCFFPARLFDSNSIPDRNVKENKATTSIQSPKW
jgi:hypothetical protein